MPHRPPHITATRGTASPWLLIAIILLGLGASYGIAAQRFGWWPAPWYHDALEAGWAVWEKFRPRDRYHDTNLFLRSRYAVSGVRHHESERSWGDYTLFTSGHDSGAFLIDMAGKIVHEWHLPFSKAWPDPPHIAAPLADGFVFWRRAHLFPNGDVLAVYEASGDTPYGYGLVKVDRDSNVLWRYPGRTHHDISVGPDGRIYVLIHAFDNRRLPGADMQPPFYLGDSLVILSADGKELRRVSIPQAFVNTPYADVLKLIGEHTPNWDAWHTNAVTPVTPQLASAFPFLASGQVVISIRTLSLLAAIDPERGKVVWATTGPWRRQHDPDLLPNGNILLFDNTGHAGAGGLSRVIEYDPDDARITWQYHGDVDAPFESFGKGTQQALANGNLLITEAYQGHLFEVDRNGHIVWDFVSPFRAAHDPGLLAIACGGQRFTADDLPFLTHATDPAR